MVNKLRNIVGIGSSKVNYLGTRLIKVRLWKLEKWKLKSGYAESQIYMFSMLYYKLTGDDSISHGTLLKYGL